MNTPDQHTTCHSPGGDLTDPVCGMAVTAASQHHFRYAETDYYFCCGGCRSKFAANPEQYLNPREAPLTEPSQAGQGISNGPYICPMCPEVQEDQPVPCPKCGMALEPADFAMEPPDNAELADMTHRLWISALLTLPIMLLAMGEMLGVSFASLASRRTLTWLQFGLATPVVLWGGWPFLQRARPGRWDTDCRQQSQPPRVSSASQSRLKPLLQSYRGPGCNPGGAARARSRC